MTEEAQQLAEAEEEERRGLEGLRMRWGLEMA